MRRMVDDADRLRAEGKAREYEEASAALAESYPFLHGILQRLFKLHAGDAEKQMLDAARQIEGAPRCPCVWQTYIEFARQARDNDAFSADIVLILQQNWRALGTPNAAFDASCVQYARENAGDAAAAQEALQLLEREMFVRDYL